MHLMINMHLTITVTKDVGLNGTINGNAFVFYDIQLFGDKYKYKLYLFISGLSHKTNILKKGKNKTKQKPTTTITKNKNTEFKIFTKHVS